MTGKELKIRLKEAGIKQEDAAKKLEITLRTLQNWFGHERLDANMMAKIKDNLDIDFPYYGENQEPEDGEQILTGKLIPFYDIDVAAGNSYLMNMDAAHPVGMIEIGAILKDSESALRVYGNSMTPNYPPGCVLGLKLHSDSFIVPGNVYVVETRDNRYLKRLYLSNDYSSFRCISDNHIKHSDGPMAGEYCYPEFEIPIDEVIRMHRVVGIIKRSIL